MKIFFLLTFCFTIAFAPMASSAQKQDEVKPAKSKTHPAKNFQHVGPKKVSPARRVPQAPKMHRTTPPTPVNPRIHHMQPKVRQPVTTVQPNPKIHREDWQDQPRIHRNPKITQVPRITPPVTTENDRKWNRNDQNNNNRDWRNRNDRDDSNRNWRNRNSNDNNSWQHARRRHHRQHRHRDWWRSHYTRFALFGTGYYFWDGGYWFPAYGYDPAYNTYSYEEPIYGYGDLEPAQVIANVQTELQRLGYYRYAVDGQMGPMTRAAIANFQRDNGLMITSAIDEPTLGSLGLG